jgi:hypothetical protein
MLKPFAAVTLVAAFTAWAQQPQEPVDITAEPHHHHVLENIFIRVYAVDVVPKQSTLMHRHGHDYLSVSLGQAEITNNRPGVPAANVKFKDGDVRFAASPLVHAVTDNLDTPFRNYHH